MKNCYTYSLCKRIVSANTFTFSRLIFISSLSFYICANFSLSALTSPFFYFFKSFILASRLPTSSEINDFNWSILSLLALIFAFCSDPTALYSSNSSSLMLIFILKSFLFSKISLRCFLRIDRSFWSCKSLVFSSLFFSSLLNFSSMTIFLATLKMFFFT